MKPTIVMGVSGKAYEHLDVEACRDRDVPVIRRYSGGGTVVVDNDTFLVTFIMSQDAEPDVVCFPRRCPIPSWLTPPLATAAVLLTLTLSLVISVSLSNNNHATLQADHGLV